MSIMKITAFEIARCGYYRRGQAIPEFGELDAILDDLSNWVAPKSLNETKTFEPDGDDTLPVYCFDIRKSASCGNVLLTTWNEVPMVEGGVPVASGTARVGHVDVELAEVSPGGIPGFPTYFYLMPSSNLLFSIRPEGSKHSGHQGLLKFMKGYMEKASSHVVRDPDGEEADNCIVGYRKDTESNLQSVYPGFVSRLKRLPGQTDYLIRHRAEIRKLVRHDTLKLSEHRDRHLIGKLLENVGWLDRQLVEQSMAFRYELDFQPTDAELQQLIDELQPSTTRESKIGFLLTGSQDIYWLDHSFAKDEVQMRLAPDQNGVLPPQELLGLLDGMRNRLLAIANTGSAIDLGPESQLPSVLDDELASA